MKSLQDILDTIDSAVWGPVMLILLVGTGIFLTFRLSFLPWRNLFYSLKKLMSKESRTLKDGGKGDVSPFAALMTALAATIGTGNIVGVATAMVAGGPGALVWMWISAAFGITSKFAECALAIKYRVVNDRGEMLGGPMYSIKAAFHNKLPGKILAVLFAIFAIIASFGIGNLTQANSISDAIDTTFAVPTWVTGLILTVLALLIILGGIKTISKVSSVLVPAMAIFYIIAGLVVIFGNISGIPDGLKNIFIMAFSGRSVAGGIAGTLTATIMNSIRYGVGRGVFSNEAGMGSAAITAAAAHTDNHIRQGYINMCGTFLDTIVVCTITGLAIASSGVLGTTNAAMDGKYIIEKNTMTISAHDIGSDSDFADTVYAYALTDTGFSLTDSEGNTTNYVPCEKERIATNTKTDLDKEMEGVKAVATETSLQGTWQDESGNNVKFSADGRYESLPLTTGAKLTIEAFRSVLGDVGAYIVTIGLILFAFSTILGWEYHGEKALEFLVKKPLPCYIYRVVFSLIVYVGAVVSLDIVWSFSDIANALMIVPNLIALLILSGKLAKDTKEFQSVLKAEKAAAKANKSK
ncbi:MAG: sodium:alanine symporter family protein [Oscillospiraceae bacterium]|nr:sodium:alanine symporter family protein [Oscillospiraceae bacterium]